MDVSLRRFFIGEVPWFHWWKPLWRWSLLMAMTYVVLMTLNVLIFRQWAHNERLTYPLAELPKALVGGTDAEGQIPAIFQSGLFWMGFCISFGVMGWNMLCAAKWLPETMAIQLVQYWSEYVINTQFQALAGVHTEIFFTMIGLSFLIPKNISFSLWFFQVVFMVELLVLVWMGQGVDMRSFPSNWWHVYNFMTAEAHGAVIVFAGVVMFKCRKYLLCAFLPGRVCDLERDEQIELKWASLGFIGCSIGIIIQLSWGMGANLGYTIFCYLMILIVTIGMVRAVAEGGLLGVKTFVSPFHFIRSFFGMNQSWTSVTLFTPLILYYGIGFMDIKAFIAPQMANALKLRDDFKMRRGLFHLTVALAILAAGAVAVITVLILCYTRGADAMGAWFYTHLPRDAMNTIGTMAKDAPAPAPTSVIWLVSGAGAMAALLYLRQFIFWLPHPLGMIMLINPAMAYYWFSILLGWLGNLVVTKYGNKDAYRRACGFFIGLIVGELIVVILSIIVSISTGTQIRIDLNRF